MVERLALRNAFRDVARTTSPSSFESDQMSPAFRPIWQRPINANLGTRNGRKKALRFDGWMGRWCRQRWLLDPFGGRRSYFSCNCSLSWAIAKGAGCRLWRCPVTQFGRAAARKPSAARLMAGLRGGGVCLDCRTAPSCGSSAMSLVFVADEYL